MFSMIDFCTMEIGEALCIAKNTFRQAAIFVRVFCIEEEADSHPVTITILSSIARSVWTGNIALAKKIHAKHALGVEHLNITGSHPSLVNPANFEAAFSAAKSVQLDRDKKMIESIPNTSDSNRSYKKMKRKENLKKAALF